MSWLESSGSKTFSSSKGFWSFSKVWRQRSSSRTHDPESICAHSCPSMLYLLPPPRSVFTNILCLDAKIVKTGVHFQEGAVTEKNNSWGMKKATQWEKQILDLSSKSISFSVHRRNPDKHLLFYSKTIVSAPSAFHVLSYNPPRPTHTIGLTPFSFMFSLHLVHLSHANIPFRSLWQLH